MILYTDMPIYIYIYIYCYNMHTQNSASSTKTMPGCAECQAFSTDEKQTIPECAECQASFKNNTECQAAPLHTQIIVIQMMKVMCCP